MSAPRWGITPDEVRELRRALARFADRHDLEATLNALAGWALALVDASGIAIAVNEAPGELPVVRAVAGRGFERLLGRRLVDVGSRHGLIVPIRVQEHEAGLVLARPRRGQVLDESDAEVLRLLATQASIALGQERSDARIALASAREEAAAAERARLARELHDDTAQQLVAIGRRLDLLRLKAGESLSESIDAVHDMVDKALVDVRRISRNLRPAILEDLGLVAALEALVADAHRGGEGLVTFEVEGTPRELSKRTELALYRVAQEAVANARTHAGAACIKVTLRFASDEVAVEVSDDGCGFAAPTQLGELVKSGGLGLMGMKERAEEVGGRLELVATSGKGTTVRALLPAAGPQSAG